VSGEDAGDGSGKTVRGYFGVAWLRGRRKRESSKGLQKRAIDGEEKRKEDGVEGGRSKHDDKQEGVVGGQWAITV
jgi:hypothetical protein